MKTMLSIVAVALLSGTAMAESMQCRNGILSLGDSKYETTNKCGEPASKESYQKPVGYGATVTVDEWTYDFGPNEFVYIVYLQSGKVSRIESTRDKGTSKGTPR